MPASCATCDHPRRLELGLRVHGVLGLGDRQPHRPARRHQKALRDAAHLRHFAQGVALGADDHAVGRQVDDGAGLAAATQIGQRHAVRGEAFEQREALRARPALEALEQALGGEVDRLAAHVMGRLGQAGVRRRAQNHRRMIVLGIDPGLGQHRLRRRRAPRRTARGARRRRDHRRPPGRRAGAPAGRHPRGASTRCSPSTRQPPSRWRSCTSARTCAPRSRSGTRAASRCSPPGGAACRAPATRRSRSRARCAATAAPTRTRWRAWSSALLGLREPPRPDHAADALAVAICHANCAPLASALAGVGGMIALLRGEVALRRADHVVVMCGERRLPRGGLSRDAAPRARGRRAGHAARAPDRARRRAPAVRLPLRAGARPVPDAARRAGGRAEGGARDPLRRHAARADRRDRRAATPRASRRSRASASAPPSGSSSSCARRSA